MGAFEITSDPSKPENRHYRPYGAALEAFHRRDFKILVEGPAGTGKTRGILEKVHLCCEKYPGMRALLCRQTRASMTDSVLVTFEEKVLPPRHPALLGSSGRLLDRKNRHNYRYPNGSEIVVKGIDDWEGIMSSEYDMIAIFEATETQSANVNILASTRLRNGVMPYQQLICDCNPSVPSHWLNVEAGEGKFLRLKSVHEDNPHLYDHQAGAWTKSGEIFINQLDQLAGVYHKRLRLGLWCAAEGVVYANFDRNESGLDWVYNPELPTYAWLDFGYRQPVCLFVQHDIQSDPDRWVIFDEVCPPNCARDVFGQRIVDRGYRLDALWGDPAGDAENDTGISTIQFMADTFGLCVQYTTEESKRSIPAGVEIVRSLIRNGKGVRRLFVDIAKCPKTTEAFETYSYPPKVTTDMPLKDGVSDHWMDAVRYGCVNQVGLAVDFSCLGTGGQSPYA